MARRRRRGSRGRAPLELRMAYGPRARPLGRTVLSFLPPPGTPCPACRGGAGCLACCRWAHLLRDDDPAAYRSLITRAVCAVAPACAAPPPPQYTPGSAGHSQAKLVRETIKLIMVDRSCTTKNVICSGYREGGQTRCISELISSSSWDILLHRIGDLLMCYILRYSSIFLPVKKNDFFQVTGPPLNVVLQKPIFSSTMAKSQQPQSTKEKCLTCHVRCNAEIAQNISGDTCVNNSNFGFYSLDTTTWKFDALQSSGSYGAARITEPNCSSEECTCSKFPSINRSTKCSSLNTQNHRKRKRLYSWQRRNKQKQICSEDRSSTGWSKINNSNFIVRDILLEDSGADVNDEVHYLDPTVANNSLAMGSDVNNSQTKEPAGVSVLSSEKSPSFVFDIRPSQGLSCGYNTSRIQSTCPQIGLSNFLHLNSGPICFNCLMLYTSKCVSVDSLIPRHAIFYNSRTSYNVFHGNHILSKRKRSDVLSLIKHIFGIKGCCSKFLKFDCHESTTTNSNFSCLSLLKMMKNLIRNSKRCQYKKLFLKHSSVKSKVATSVAKNDSKARYSTGGKSAYYDESFVQLEAYSTYQQVVSFVWAVLTCIVPEPLLGNSYSKRSLRTNIWKFIKLRRFETFHLSDCIGELKVSHYSWISNIGLSDCNCFALMANEIGLSNGSEEKHKNVLHCWIKWLFSDIVIPLVEAYFYVTERESRRYDVFYYPKTIWRDLTSNAIASLNRQSFKILRGTSRKAIKHSCCSSRVRFVPKAKDMRPLVNLKAQSKDGLLNKCHLIIKKVRDENPEMFGSSVFDYNNVHQNLSHFISSVRSHLKEKFKIYIVVADVLKAFDYISHDMVLKIVDDVLKCDDYVLRKCTKVVCNGSKNAIYRFDSNVSISKGNNICDFSIQLSSSGGILVDQGKTSIIRKKELQCLLSEQVKHSILKIGHNFYLQQVGIAQGSKLSPNLCSLYYGHLENSVLSKFLHDGKIISEEDVSTPKSLLMRFIDDFIFISFSKKRALNFFNRMRRGFVYYNCYMNDSKYGFNFEVANSEHCRNRLYRGDDGFSFIPWSGLLINCESLEIQADYTRYVDINISSTITVKMHSSTKYLQSKLCHYMRPKCHPIFYDSTINSPCTVKLNIYQAFLLCAMKFHCYVRSMPDVNMSKPELLHIIKRTFRYMHSLIVRRTQDVELQYNVRPVLKLRRKETMWLGLSAYLRVLQKKQSRYKDLLALLTEEIGRYGHLDHNIDSLRYAVDDSHSSMFWKFKF
ncbi:telomerase reverse transcriptase isoform X2 [Phragmites australis]|uniref:telomerase reverse transcriptase isoform X2 n=1 Tax=Phragmites australis TaxID=29695 RepID=UPI002D77C5A2|nr:telomerase reverse transcriptase isoform X2 [Phragmites australis]